MRAAVATGWPTIALARLCKGTRRAHKCTENERLW